MAPMDEEIEALADALLALDEPGAIAVTRELIEAGADPQVVLQRGLADTMLEVGRRWNAGELFLPEVVAAAEIFRLCNEIVEPALIAAGGRTLGHRVVMATVKGDLHDLGKNMVGAMMKTAGFEVHDLGKDVPAERIVEAVRELEPSIVGLSSLLTTTVPEQRGVLTALEEAGLRRSVKVMVGGAPVTEEWARQIGADGFAPNAPEAVRVALALVGDERLAGA
ncbi:MAG TPA: cobalamin-dependent protein [Actinomycetota bacterium]|nr:cobalamin-dependent protein [Actinomycetota bacterium]